MKKLSLVLIPLLALFIFVVYSNINPKIGSVSAGIYPDKTLTPGAVNPNITQANISQNICNSSWSTKSIRPPSNYTTSLKVNQITKGNSQTLPIVGSYYNGDTNPKDYEEDHLISLELGGNPTDPRNLWPESYNTKPSARDKDQVENYLHKQICTGNITLAEAQKEISTDWVKVLNSMKSKSTFGSVGISNSDD